jgi:hypothetical protein
MRTRLETSPGDVTRLLQAWSGGDLRAQEALLPLVYAELRRRAAAYLRRERRGHTLQPTALVHETYLRLVNQRDVDWNSRGHFYRAVVTGDATRAGGSRSDSRCPEASR